MRLSGIFTRVVLSVFFAGIFYIGWMAVAIPVLKSDLDMPIRIVFWMLAPIVTGFGFAAGHKTSELFVTAEKSHFGKLCMWYIAGCAFGGGIVFPFGPMLIVFGMFAVGTLSVIVHEILRIQKHPRT